MLVPITRRCWRDPLYLGYRQARLRGDDYYSLVEEFVAAVMEVFPGALVQWEDFRKNNALRILDEFRHKLPSFNDDIQGTGAVAAAGVVTALRVTKGSISDQRVVIHGAGAAGLGIARQLAATMVEGGASPEDAKTNIAVLDSRGLLAGGDGIREVYKRELAWSTERAESFGLDADHRDLLSVVHRFKPQVLIGTSGQPGAFSQGIVRAMAEHTERPIILPFSNPTDYAEARPADLLAWTDGRALVATGSPFEPVSLKGRQYEIGQGNNVFIFPGLGLGCLAAGAREVTDGMITAAINALAQQVTEDELARGFLFPAISRLRQVSYQVALAVGEAAQSGGVCTVADIEATLDGMVWEPRYRHYLPG